MKSFFFGLVQITKEDQKRNEQQQESRKGSGTSHSKDARMCEIAGCLAEQDERQGGGSQHQPVNYDNGTNWVIACP